VNVYEQRQQCFGEITREQQSIDRNLLLLADKESTAKQRRALTQASAVMNKSIRHVKTMLAIS
jgi:hypothetical protein